LLLIGIDKSGITHVKRGNKSFERAEQFKYWRTAFTKQNVIREEIKVRLKMGNACYRSV
jgi:ribosomal protein L32E